jgi:hypothetical protein
MKLTFTESGWADYLWVQEHDKDLLKSPVGWAYTHAHHIGG